MKYYAGLDVGLKRTSVCVVDEHGKQVHASEVASDPEAISKALLKLRVEYDLVVGLEQASSPSFFPSAAGEGPERSLHGCAAGVCGTKHAGQQDR